MNKGVKLLLERKKTHPEEFCSMGRWTGLLIAFDAYPLSEEVIPKPKNPRQFNKLVMHRLLTASDLEETWATVRLTSTQLLLAKKLGITPEVYAEVLLAARKGK